MNTGLQQDDAVHLGKALQLTNILRDVRVDSLSAAVSICLNRNSRDSESAKQEILRFEYSDRFFELASSVADAGPDLLRRRANGTAEPETAVHGGRRADGFGLLAAARKA